MDFLLVVTKSLRETLGKEVPPGLVGFVLL